MRLTPLAVGAVLVQALLWLAVLGRLHRLQADHAASAGEAREDGEARAAAERHCQEAADRAAARQATQEKALGELRRQLGEKDVEWVKRLSEAEGQLGEARAKGEVLAATAHVGEHPRVYEGSYAAPAARRPVRPERTAVFVGRVAGREVSEQRIRRMQMHPELHNVTIYVVPLKRDNPKNWYLNYLYEGALGHLEELKARFDYVIFADDDFGPVDDFWARTAAAAEGAPGFRTIHMCAGYLGSRAGDTRGRGRGHSYVLQKYAIDGTIDIDPWGFADQQAWLGGPVAFLIPVPELEAFIEAYSLLSPLQGGVPSCQAKEWGPWRKKVVALIGTGAMEMFCSQKDGDLVHSSGHASANRPRGIPPTDVVLVAMAHRGVDYAAYPTLCIEDERGEKVAGERCQGGISQADCHHFIRTGAFLNPELQSRMQRHRADRFRLARRRAFVSKAVNRVHRRGFSRRP